ncbi:hypothetical protein SEA_REDWATTLEHOG_150 [Gordonia phage RedWattleHog]|uniref:Uncharacterized protein n=1 Tax=Gordonia phage Stormageddon TaxID=2656541 RepID=A0A649VRY5_9CAUD|nr:hypothetical protein KHQ86_gp149 [Gordonia phage Stormageddon]QGJ95011.1 hypothetical protein SEA_STORMAGEDDON_151 [Gordonia phage Stormageddon]QLF83653.1 hypothetical protein SEA_REDWATTLEHOG_150 [Gordonia phage RedWattleHog]
MIPTREIVREFDRRYSLYAEPTSKGITVYSDPSEPDILTVLHLPEDGKWWWRTAMHEDENGTPVLANQWAANGDMDIPTLVRMVAITIFGTICISPK